MAPIRPPCKQARAAALLATTMLAGCATITANKHTYADPGGASVHGASLALQVSPQGDAGGSFMFSAMVVGAGAATLDGPFAWRIVATGRDGIHQELIIHRLHTRTATTRRSEWFPPDQLGRRALFRPTKDQPGAARARYDIPGMLDVKPRHDGALTVTADVSIKASNTWRRATVRFHLKPDQKRQTEFLFLPAEIIHGITTDPADWDDPMWD